MKLYKFLTEAINYAKPDPKPEQDIVDKFAGVSDKLRSYYINKWAEEKGINSDDAMFKAGYIKDGYIGAGAWNWRYVGMDESIDEVAGAKDCWDGYKKDGTQPGTGKNKGKRVNKCVKEDESGMIGEPDSYYDAEDRTKAYNDLQDILQGNFMDDYIKDGVCPECAGSGYMDGEETFTNDDGEEEESSECDGFGNYGCDEGEMTQNDDGLPNWKVIADHDYNQEIKAERENKPQPSDEILLGAIEQLHKNYVKTGRFNAFELPSILRQMYPEISKQKARQIGSEFLGSFSEQAELRKLAGLEETVPYSKSTQKDLDDRIWKAAEEKQRKEKDAKRDSETKEKVKEGDSDEAMVSKMLAKALGDENKWTEMSAPELYAELESSNSYMADMIRYLAKMLYDVKLEERAYKDVGVADTVKDQRGKEFNFDKNTKKFKSQDGEEADVKTKLGKDLMRIRKNQMKKTTPSYKTKKNQGHKVMASIEEAYGDNHEITLEDNEDFNDVFGVLGYSLCEQDTFEAEYQGRKVKLNKPMQGDTKKFKVYVKDPKTGNVKKVNFGHGGSSVKGKTMRIRKSNPKARKSFRARHNCDNPGPKTKARYWSCRKW